MMSEEEYYEWLAQADLEFIAESLFKQYQNALKYQALRNHGVDNWSGYSDAMQSLESEEE